MKPNKKKKKWIKARHKVITKIACLILYPYTRWKYGITIERFKEQGNRQYLVLMNHQTPFDQFFIGMAFKGAIYYIATEDIFSLGWLSSLLRFAVAPIPIKKQTTDIGAVKTCYRVAKEGGTIALAPEGNRTYSGRTEYMNPAIVSLAKTLKLPIALFRIEGGYGKCPRWSDVVRKGKMRAYVSRVVEPEEYGKLSDEELLTLIQEGLYVDEATVNGEFHHPKLAEYLERAIYVCPYCGLSTFESHDDIIKCKKCNREIRYLPTKELKGVGFDFPFHFVAEWYDYQCDFVNKLNILDDLEAPIFQDTASLSEVIINKKKISLQNNIKIDLYGDRIIMNPDTEKEMRFSFIDVSAISVLGKNKLNIYFDKKVYQLKGDKHFNALKYVNFYYRHKNIYKGDNNGKFLGL